MTVYMEVTKDIYELPVAIADSVEKLAKIRKVSANAISSRMYHCKKRGYWCRYLKVEIEDD